MSALFDTRRVQPTLDTREAPPITGPRDARRLRPAGAPQPTGHLSPVERLGALCDPGSLQLLRTAVRSPSLEDRAIDGDGVTAGAGQVGGRPILCYAEDPAFLGGSLGAQHAATIVELLRLAERGRRPVIGFVSSGGARLQEGLAALGGYGEIFAAMTRLSGVVLQLSVVSGSSAGGGAYAPALGEIVIMTRDAHMFLTGPGVIAEVLGEQIDAQTLGGSRVQAVNGVAQFVVQDDLDGAALARSLLGLLPSAAGDPLPHPAQAIRAARCPRTPGRCTTCGRSSPASPIEVTSWNTVSAGRRMWCVDGPAWPAARWDWWPTSLGAWGG